MQEVLNSTNVSCGSWIRHNGAKYVRKEMRWQAVFETQSKKL